MSAMPRRRALLLSLDPLAQLADYDHAALDHLRSLDQYLVRRARQFVGVDRADERRR